MVVVGLISLLQISEEYFENPIICDSFQQNGGILPRNASFCDEFALEKFKIMTKSRPFYNLTTAQSY